MKRGTPFVAPRCRCGAVASFGHSVALREERIGTWYCRACDPCRGRGELGATMPAIAAAPASGDLFR
jgi:hypothetical protein